MSTPVIAKTEKTSLPSAGMIADWWQLRVTRLWLLLAACMCVASVVAHMQIGLNNDNLDLLDQVQRLLAGGKPYIAYADVNPPLIHLLYVLPVLLSHPTTLSIATALYVVTFAAIALSLVVSAFLLKYSKVHDTTYWVVLSTMALAQISISFINHAFADRDHLTMVLASPWFILCSPLAKREAIPVRWRVATAIMAAIGFAIKPYSYIFYIASAGFVLCFERPLRVLIREWEHYVIGIFALVYIAVIFLCFHEYVAAVLPLALNTYGTASWTLEGKIGVVEYDLFGKYGVVPLVETALLLIVSPTSYDRTITYLLFLLAACVGSFMLNGGWYYTQYPFIAVALVLSVAVANKLILVIADIRNGAMRRLCFTLFGLMLAAGLFNYFVRPVVSRAGWDIKLTRERGHPLSTIEMPETVTAKIDAHMVKHPRFMFFSNISRSVNLLKDGTPRQNVGRYDYLWPVPGLLVMEKQPYRQQDYQRFSSYFINSLAEDIERNTPDMIINDISTYQYNLPPSYNIIGWLKKNPRFAKDWGNYTLVDTLNACTADIRVSCAFEIYYRKSKEAE